MARTRSGLCTASTMGLSYPSREEGDASARALVQSVDQLAEPTPGRVTEALDAVGPLHPGKLLTDIGVDGAGKGGVDCGEVKH